MKTYIQFEHKLLAGLAGDGGEGAATAATDKVDAVLDSVLQGCRAEKYAAGSNFAIEARGRGGERFEVSDAGVVSCRPMGRNKKTGEQEYDCVRVCGRLDVIGKSRNADGGSWGRVISFRDGDGVEHRVTLSMEDILSGGTGLSQKLGGKGLSVTDLSVVNNLASVNRYILSFDESDLKTIKTVAVGGWSDESFSCFVLGEKTVRTAAGDYAELAADAVCAPVKSRGSLAEWQSWLMEMAPYSDRLSFAVMVALAAPLLPIVGDMSRLWHFYGGSSTGKSTAVKVAATVWGGLDWVRSWNTTKNAPAALAKQFNGLPLVFDELKAARKVAGDVSYILSSGMDRARCGRDGKAQTAESWALYVLSTGEGSLQEIKQQTCRGADADTATGELVRFIDIPAVADLGNPENGIFESLPDEAKDVEGRKRWIDRHCSAPAAYGTAGLAFLDALERDIEANGLEAFRTNLVAWMDEFSAGAGATSATTSRVVKAFAIVAAAGELARQYGVLPWAEGESARVAKTCLKAWRSSANTLEDREESFVGAVLDDTKRCEASYTSYRADGSKRGAPAGAVPSFGALLIRDNDGEPETMCAAYSSGEFSDLLKRTGGGVMKGEAVAFLKKHGRLVSNRKGADDGHAGDFRTPDRKRGVLPLGLRMNKFYKLVLISDDKAAVLQLLDALKLNPPKEA